MVSMGVRAVEGFITARVVSTTVAGAAGMKAVAVTAAAVAAATVVVGAAVVEAADMAGGESGSVLRLPFRGTEPFWLERVRQIVFCKGRCLK